MGVTSGTGWAQVRGGPGECTHDSPYQLMSILFLNICMYVCTLYIKYVLQLTAGCYTAVYIYRLLHYPVSSHCCQVINVFLVTCLAPHCSPHQNTLGLDNNRETHYGIMMMSNVPYHLPKTNYIWHDPLSTYDACHFH